LWSGCARVPRPSNRWAPSPAHAAAFLYDLTELQRHANRLYGFTAQRTLELARPLRAPQAAQLSAHRQPPPFAGCGPTLPRVVAAVQAPYRELLAPGTGERPLGRRFVDDAKSATTTP